MIVRFAAVGIFLLGCSICLSQTPAVTPSWQELATTSSLVVIGIVDESSLVIRPDREISKAKPLSNGQVIVELQNPADYVLGSLVRLRLKEVIKQNGTVKSGETINIFLPGFFPAEGQPVLAEKQSYLVFLSPLKDSKELRASLVHEETTPPKNVPFPLKSNYAVNGDANGALHVTLENKRLIKQVRIAIAKVKEP
jgi:hypothetical protein